MNTEFCHIKHLCFLCIYSIDEIITVFQRKGREKRKIVKGKYDAGHKKNIWEEMKIKVKIHDRKMVKRTSRSE